MMRSWSKKKELGMRKGQFGRILLRGGKDEL